MISLVGLEKSFRSPGEDRLQVLAGVDLQVPGGCSVGILGRSGSGKSTLLSIVGLLETPDAGSYELGGRRVDGLSDHDAAMVRSEYLGFVFQRSFLLPHLTASQNVEVPLLHGRRVPLRRVRLRLVTEALEKVGIAHRSRHKPSQLSGGEQQLVALARALVRDPKLILADEPTGNLDPGTGERVVRALAALAVGGDRSLIMVTHDRELASLLDKRYLLVQGKLAALP